MTLACCGHGFGAQPLLLGCKTGGQPDVEGPAGGAADQAMAVESAAQGGSQAEFQPGPW